VDPLAELQKCLEHPECPLDKHTKNNLLFLITIRHEIEHQMTSRIDDALSAKLQACALNFNRVLRQFFGDGSGIEAELPTAIQFATFSLDQQKTLIHEKDIPANILAAQTAFENGLSADDYNHERYAFRIALVQKTVSNKGSADQVVEFVRAGTQEGDAINRVLMKEVEKQKYKPAQIVKIMQAEGFTKFKVHHHSTLWKTMKAQEPKKGFGVKLGDGTWYWYEAWLATVRQHCAENAGKYQ
jgi:hypothetical protein